MGHPRNRGLAGAPVDSGAGWDGDGDANEMRSQVGMSANIHINRVSIEATVVCQECGHVEPKCFFEFSLGHQKWQCSGCRAKAMLFLNLDTATPDDKYEQYLRKEAKRAIRGEGDGIVLGEDEWQTSREG